MDICTVTGTIDKKDGTTPQASAAVRVLKLVKDDELISTAELVTRTDSDGAFSFTVPRLSTAYVYSGLIEGFDKLGGVPVAIPDADAVELKTLLPARNPPSNAVSQSAFNTHRALIASSVNLGHVRIGAGISIALDGTISVPAVSQEIVEDYLASFFNSTTPALHAVYDDTGNTVDLSIDNATPTVAGLMSAADKAYVNGLPGALSALQPLNPSLTAISTLTPSANDVLQYKSGAWINRTLTQFKTDLAIVAGDISNFNTTVDARIASTIGASVQGYDSDLAAVAGLSTTGLIARTATGAASTRTLTPGSSKLTVTNGDGVSGNPTVDLGTLTASDIPTLTSAKLSDFNSAASAAAPVQSVNGSTGAVSLTLPTTATATASQFFTAYNAVTGAFTKAQPAFTDLSGSASVAQIPTLTSAKISDFNSAASAAAPVQSVFGRPGVVSAQNGDYNTGQVTEGTNLYYTDARARAALSGTTNQVNYNSATGVFSLPQNVHTGATPTFAGMTLTGSLGVNLSGVAAPTAFTVGDTASTTPRGLMSWQASNDTSSAHLHMRKSRGTFSAPLTIVSGDILGRVVFGGYEGTNYNESAYIRATSAGTIATNRVPSTLEFFTSTDAAPSVATRALLLDKDQSATFASTVTATTFVGALTGTASGNLTSASGLNASNLTSGTVPSARLSLVASDIPSTLNATTFSSGITLGTSGNLFGGTNTVEQRNGTSAQTFNLYKTFTDSSNYVRLSLTADGITRAPLGTGTGGDFTISTDTSDYVILAGGAARFKNGSATFFDSGGGFATWSENTRFSPDNTYDIGVSGATRPRNIFVAGYVSAGRNIAAKTTNFAVTAALTNAFFTNTGASGEVDFTLPTAAVGLTFTFYVDAAQTVKVIAGTSTTIRIAGSVSASAGNITNATPGGSIRLTAISSTQWVAEFHEGTWTVN